MKDYKEIVREIEEIEKKGIEVEDRNYSKKFTGAGLVMFIVKWETVKEMRKQGIEVEKDSYYGWVVESISSNGALQEVEDMAREFAGENTEFRIRVYLS